MLALLCLVMVLPGLASLPVIDRDEARYAVASQQMAQTDEFLDIRFQDEARYKKPAGIYWLQSAALKIASSPEKRQIWVHRIPSVLGALLAVLMTYWGAVRLIGRQGAMLASAMLATSLIFVFEGHVAKTDAVLCGLSASVFAAIAHLRNPASPKTQRRAVWVFWAALGASIMIKGPIILGIAALAMIALWAWERNLKWARPLFNWGAILLFLVIWLPWAIAIYIKTDGVFFAESLGRDMGGKLASTQENHAGPPGYHSLIIWLALWPACLFLLPAIAYAWKALRSGADTPVIHAMRFCAVWILPFWAIIEIMPTKLPHYSLPLFPAICTVMAASVLAMLQVKIFPFARFFGGLFFILATTAICGALLFALSLYGPDSFAAALYAAIGAAAFICLLAGFFMWGNKAKWALWAGGLGAIAMSALAYIAVLPNLTPLRIAENIAAEFGTDIPRLGGAEIATATYTEPSLVYHLGRNVLLGDQTDIYDMEALANGRRLLIDAKSEETSQIESDLKFAAEEANMCLTSRPITEGFNYATGKAVSIISVTGQPCPNPTTPETPSE